MKGAGRFSERLLRWYRNSSRTGLPWRGIRDPYRIWVSETMLQQTQVSTVIPYYRRFLARFPTLRALSRARLREVLETWSGLGYYHRAKNLHACARTLAAEHGGRLPQDPENLRKLPGIGRYTAGAIASIAFDRPAPVLDGNVQRVLCRTLGIREDPRQPAVQRRLWDLAARLVPEEAPGDFNQALMDLGATVCTPRTPACVRCPISSDCRARRLGLQEKIPPPRVRPKRPVVDCLCGILQRNGSVLIARRPESGLLPGLWEFPGGTRDPESSDQETLERILSDRLGLRVRAGRKVAQHTQILTHRELRIRAYLCRPERQKGSGTLVRAAGIACTKGARPLGLTPFYTEARWVRLARLQKVSFTAGMREIARLTPPIYPCERKEAGAGNAEPPPGRRPGTAPWRRGWTGPPRR